MSDSRARHFLRVLVIALVIGAVGCATRSASTSTYPSTSGSGMHSGMAGDNSRAALSKAMRDLWADHVVWTRNYIIAASTDGADAQAAATRLLANQDQIGQAIVPYYGADAGRRLSALLRDHIL